MQRKASILFLLVLSSFVLGAAFHHHPNGLPNDHCSYCLTAHHSPFVQPTLLLFFQLAAFIMMFSGCYWTKEMFEKTPVSIRAPPSSYLLLSEF